LTELKPIGANDVIANRYRIVGVLGSGGMAMVYEAEHQLTGRRCALKMIHSHLARRPEFTALFLKEARVGSAIGRNPHIVEVLDADFDAERGSPFLAMELLEGETVGQCLIRQGPFAHMQAIGLFLQLADAFTQAHERGVVHRDLKTSNLFLVSNSGALPLLKVMDFGIAKILGEGAQHTATQMGTPMYLAPEQMGAGLRQLAEKEGIHIATGVSVGTDIWSLGLLAYEMLTGLSAAQYWNSEVSADLFLRVVLYPLPPPSVRAGDQSGRLPQGFDAWFDRCMRKDATERWASFAEAVTELARLLESVQIERPKPIKTVMQTVQATNMVVPNPPQQVTEITTEAFAQTAPIAANAVDVPSPVRRRSVRTKLLVGAAGALLLALVSYWPVKSYLEQRSERYCDTLPPGQEKLDACQQACQSGRSLGCNDLGQIYEQGLGIEKKDATRAADLYDQACSAGNPLSCKNLENMYSTGKWVAKDEVHAAELHQKACDSGEMKGCSNLGAVYELGNGVEKKDKKRAAELYQKACNSGEVDGCRRLARMVANGNGVANLDSNQVVELLQKACNGGDMALCRDLALRYETGNGVNTKDEKRAAELYQKACNGGEMSGCTHLGGMYKDGTGVEKKDERRAVEFYQKACDGGEVISCNNLAHMYLKGKGVDRIDDRRAAELFQKACAGGEMMGCGNLAGMYLNGIGVDQRDEKRAVELYKKACTLGNKDACVEQQRLAPNSP
jgi:TPR repeat protein/serine/threonine protein kinase